MNLNIAVIEDEVFFYDQLAAFIRNWADRSSTNVQCKSFLNEDEFMKFVHNSIAFDAVFMDIFLKNDNGMELAYRIRKYNASLPIVFATATSDYLREGYEVQAIGYLVKPFQQIKIDKCMNRILHLSGQSGCRDFSFKSEGIVRVIPINSILYFECRDHYIFVHCSDQVFKFREKMNTLQQRLPPEFLRCNRNTIINLNYLFSFNTQEIKLTDQTCFRVSHDHQKCAKLKCFQQLAN